MADIALDELTVIADFLTEAPAICLDIFKGAGIKTLQLLTFSESEFSAAINAGPKSTLASSQLWSWVENWRKRNGLVNVTIVTEPAENCDTQPEENSERALTANNGVNYATGEDEVHLRKRNKPPGARTKPKKGTCGSSVSRGESDYSSKSVTQKAAPLQTTIKIEATHNVNSDWTQAGSSTQSMRNCLDQSRDQYDEQVLQNSESLLIPDIWRGQVSNKPGEPSGHAVSVTEYCVPEDFEVEDSSDSHTANNSGSFPIEQSEGRLKKQRKRPKVISGTGKDFCVRSFLSRDEDGYCENLTTETTSTIQSAVKVEATTDAPAANNVNSELARAASSVQSVLLLTPKRLQHLNQFVYGKQPDSGLVHLDTCESLGQAASDSEYCAIEELEEDLITDEIEDNSEGEEDSSFPQCDDGINPAEQVDVRLNKNKPPGVGTNTCSETEKRVCVRLRVSRDRSGSGDNVETEGTETVQGTVEEEATGILPVVRNIHNDPVQPESNTHTLPLLTPNRLRQLVEQSTYGKQVLTYAKTKLLSTSGRKLVLDIVARYHIAQNRPTSSQAVSDLSDVIIEVFQKESKKTFYIPKTGRGSPGGKLYSRINYIKQSERNRDRREEEHVTSETNSNEALPEPEVTSAVAWLELNKFPWTAVLSQWETSFPARKPLLRKYAKASSIITSYPHLSEEHGYQLLDIDYQKLGLGNPNEGCNKWNSLFEPIAKFVAKQARDPSSKELIRAIQDPQHSIDHRLLHTLLALNTVLIPVKAAKGFKPTVATAQSDTFLLVKNKNDALAELDKIIKVYEDQQIPVPPKLIVVGANLASITGECMVVYKSIVYSLRTIVRGIDVLVKLRIILGLPVAKLSKLVWVFTEQFVYSVPSDNGGYVCVNNLIDFLNKQEQ